MATANTGTLTYQTKTLKTALQALKPYADLKATNPCLAAVKLTAEYAATTDLETFARYALGGDGDGTALVPLKPLMAALKNIKTPTVTLNLWADDDIEQHSLNLAGTVLRTLPSEDAPHHPDYVPCEAGYIPDFVTALRAVWPAVSADETRLALCSVHIEDGRLVACDSYRLHVAPVSNAEWLPPVNIRRSTLAGVLKLKDPAATVSVGHVVTRGKDERDLCCLEFGPLTLVGLLQLGDFPRWQQLVPADTEQTITIDRQTLRDHAAAALKFSGSRGNEPLRVDYNGNGHLNLTLEKTDVGTYAVDMPCESDSEPLAIGFHPEFLRDVLDSFAADTIHLRLNGALRPLLVEDAGQTAVLMPIRLND